MLRERAGELRVRGDHRRTQGADRALLLEQRRGVQRAPLPGGEDAGADLHVDVPVRVTRPRSLVPDTDHLHPLDGHDLPRIPRPDPRDGALTEPPAYLRQGVLLRSVEGANDFFRGGTALSAIDSGRARKLLQAFGAGRWRRRDGAA